MKIAARPPVAPQPSPTANCPTGPHPSASLCWSWSQGSGDPAQGFKVYRGTAAGAGTVLATVDGATNLQYMDTAVVAGQTYYYTVSAYNSGGESTRSNEVTCSIPFSQPTGQPQLSGQVN